MNRITHTSSASTAMALQQAAELRKSQATAAQTTSSQTTPVASEQADFAEIFGYQTAAPAAKPSTASAAPSTGTFQSAIATATAKVLGEDTGERKPVSKPIVTTTAPTTTSTSASAPTTTTSTASSTTTTTASTATTTTTAAATSADTGTTTGTVANPGVGALVTAIMNGSLQPSYVTDPSQLQQSTPAGTDYMPSFYYASDQTADQIAQLLGGTVVQMPPFGTEQGWSEPLANFIQLPGGQQVNAADLAYYANTGSEGTAQLTADITSTINIGSAMTNYYQYGGAMPIFTEGYVGPPIAGMTYPASMIGSDGNVINPAMQTSVSGA
jgi:hypothetical protein